MRDDELMARAVALGDRGRRGAPPNPWVGCVIVEDGTIVGQGFHARAGEPHAEVLALAEAGERARGATAYVTLEPCSHRGRTPPCAEALIDAGIARAVVALEDPDSRVAGGGVGALRDRGIEVTVGTGAASAQRSLAPYLHHRRTGRAYCLVKAAMSLDGRVSAADGTSRWITGEAARRDAHGLRAESQAVVVGSGTALADQPSLTARGLEPPVDFQPLRVLLDARGRVPATGPLFDLALASTLVLTTELAPSAALDSWRAAGAKVEILPAADDGTGVDLPRALEVLGHDGVLQAMIEGGPTLHGALWRAGLVDRVVVYLAGALLGTGGRPVFEWPGPATLDDAPRLELLDVTVLDHDVRLDFAAPPRGAAVAECH